MELDRDTFCLPVEFFHDDFFIGDNVKRKKQIEPVSYGCRIPILTYQQLKQQQLIKQQLAIGLTLPSRSNLYRQHPVNGMKAALVDISNVRRQSAGTGVFFPKRMDIPNESRKKPACSSVIPARIFQTLNLNEEDLRFKTRIPGSSALDYELAWAHGKLPLALQILHQKQYHLCHTSAPPLPPTPAGTSHEIHLPAEWTY